MAVPATGINPTWRTIPEQNAYPGQTLTINLRNYQARQDATISLEGAPPSWATLNVDGLRKQLILAVPSSLSGGESFTIELRATAFVTDHTEIRDTNFTLRVLAPVVPAITPTVQSLQAGVAFSLDVNSFRTAGAPTPGYEFQQGYIQPAWLSLNGSTISGTPPVTEYRDDSVTTVNLLMRAVNIAGHADFTVVLQIARSTVPSISTIPPQYATQGVAFSLDVASYLGGTPTPTLVAGQSALPSWMGVEGTELSGTPTGYTETQAIQVNLVVQNVVSTTSHRFTLYVRVGSDTFTELTTGSPITVPHNNLRALAASATRLYYATNDTPGTVYVTNLAGVAQTGENIVLGSADGGSTSLIEGLAVDGGDLYVLGGTGTEHVFKYRISDGTLLGSQDTAGVSRAISIVPRNGRKYLAVLRPTGVLQFWNTAFGSSSAGVQITLAFTLSEPGVTGEDWQSLAYDSLDGKIYAGAENASGAFLFAFTPGGDRDHAESIQLDSANTEPRGAAYINDTMYVAQADSGRSTGRVFIYNSIARVLPVPAQEGFDGEAWSLDLAPYLANSITVSFRSGYQKPAWLSLANNTLTATTLPAVTRSRQDDTYTIRLTATHVDRTSDFDVMLTVKYVELPVWTVIPDQTLDQNVTPQIESPRPPLVTSFTLHLSDYIADLDRAGTVMFAFTDQENSGLHLQLSSRQVRTGVTMNDVLTVQSQRTLAPTQPVRSYSIRLEATNGVGTGNAELDIDVNVLQNTYLNRIPNQDINRDETDSLDLRRYAGGLPRPTFALGTIAPVFNEDSGTIISNANGLWSIHPNANLTGTHTFTVHVVAINRVSRANGSFQLTIHGAPAVDPATIPVWKSGADLTFAINTGAMQTIDLSLLIASSRPQPTFTIADDATWTGDSGTAAITGTNLSVQAPPATEITADTTVTMTIRASTSAGHADATLTFNVTYVELPALPTLQDIPYQAAHVGAFWSLDLRPYLTGTPTPTVAYRVGYQPPTWLTLTDGVLAGTPSGITQEQSFTIFLTVSNTAGSIEVSVTVSVSVETAPLWREVFPLQIIEGMSESFNLQPYIDGSPAPQIAVTPRTDSGLNVSVTSNVLDIVDAPAVQKDTLYNVSLDAVNAAGSNTQVIQIWVLAEVTVDTTDLTTEELNMVRQFVDTTLSVQDLPDSVLNGHLIKSAAFDWVGSLVPEYANRTERNLRRLKRAVLYRMAALTMGAFLRKTRGGVGALQEQFEIVGWQERQAQLFEWASAEVALVAEEEHEIPELAAFYAAESSFGVIFEVVNATGGY